MEYLGGMRVRLRLEILGGNLEPVPLLFVPEHRRVRFPENERVVPDGVSAVGPRGRVREQGDDNDDEACGHGGVEEEEQRPALHGMGLGGGRQGYRGDVVDH